MARRDIPQLLSLFDVAVLVSNPVVETFSNAILEYMAASLPVDETALQIKYKVYKKLRI